MNNRLSINGFMRIINVCFLMVMENFALDSGMGYFAVGYILFAWLYLILMGSIMNTVTKMVSVRIYKGLRGNAKKVFRNAMLYSVLMGVLVFAVIWVMADTISAQFFNTPYLSVILKLFGGMFLANAVADTLNGYYLGLGNTAVSNIIGIIRIIFPPAAGILLIKLMRDYGQKVAALMKDTLYTNVYAVMGGIFIQLFCSVLILLILLFCYGRIAGRKSYEKETYKKGIDSGRSVAHNFFATAFSILKNNLFPLTGALVMMLIYFYTAHSKGIPSKTVFNSFGIFTGKYVLLCLFPFLFYKEYCIREKMKIHTEVSRGESKNIQSRVQYLIKNTIFMLLPAAAMLCFLAEPIIKVLFTGDYTLSVKMLRTGGMLVFVMGLSFCLHSILCALKKETEAFFIRLSGTVITAGSLLLLLWNLNGNIMGIIYALYIGYGVMLALQFVLLYRNIQLNIEDIISKAVKTLIASGVLAVVEMILDRFILMNVPILFLSILLGYMVFYIAVFALKGISKKDELSLKRTFSYFPIHFISGRLGLWK